MWDGSGGLSFFTTSDRPSFASNPLERHARSSIAFDDGEQDTPPPEDEAFGNVMQAQAAQVIAVLLDKEWVT